MPEESRPESVAPVPSGIAAELAAAGFEDARQVARGGAGVVYCCYETALGRNVAVKVLPSHIDDDSRERFLREGYAMGGLSGHPNIVNILRVGVTTSGKPYIVMPYHSADSLAVRLRREGPVPWPEALRIGVKLCGALETAHRTGTLHRDIKPANILVNDYGEPQLSDFGIAHIEGGYETATGFFSGTIDYTSPEVMTGNPATVASDMYSLGATIYALIAGNAAHERKKGEDLIAQYLRISTTGIPDMRPDGIPDAVCSAIERAMSIDPAERPASAEEFGRELQAAQRRNGLKPDAMAITGRPSGRAGGCSVCRAGPTRRPQRGGAAVGPAHLEHARADAGAGRARRSDLRDQRSDRSRTRAGDRGVAAIGTRASFLKRPACCAAGTGPATQPKAQPPRASAPSGPNRRRPKARRAVPGTGSPPGSPSPGRSATASGWPPARPPWSCCWWSAESTSRYRPTTKRTPRALPSQPTAQPPMQWKPITNARVSRDAAATTQADGTIWIFGGIRGDGALTGLQEGYDPVIDSWKGGDDLPVPVSHAMAVTWQGNPVVLGGWKTEGGKNVASDQVWRVVNSRWVELPHLLQPRAAAAAAVVGDRLVVTGGVDANGALLNTTEVFDGNAWTLGAPIPTPRQMLAAASDGKLMYAVGGTNGDRGPGDGRGVRPGREDLDAVARAAAAAQRPRRGDRRWTAGRGRGRVVGASAQERVGVRPDDEDLVRFAGHGDRAARHGRRRGREVGVRDRRIDRCR